MKLYIFLLLFAVIIYSNISFALADESNKPIEANKILIEKSDRKMTLLKDGKAIKTYKVSLGSHPEGAKTQQGDGKTPEGKYTISGRNQNSKFHRALRVSYPNALDQKHARKLGVDPGGDIMIHGLPNYTAFLGSFQRLHDWTKGCIAVTNSEIEEIWELVPDGTIVEIRP